MDGCVLTVDGLGVSTWQPFKWEVRYPKDYRFCKGSFTIIVMAGCDIQAQFIVISCTCSDSMNDIIAWQDTNIYEMLEIQHQLTEKYFLIEDNRPSQTHFSSLVHGLVRDLTLIKIHSTSGFCI